ncbi:MAG: hypothetical protein HUU02_16760 [Bacteroidetes bacterium]|nr:hypothetical protein [Bacteroidota bacterium]
MKPVLILTVAALLLVGCTSQPMTMKSTTKYFAPATKTTKARTAAPNGLSKVSSVTAAQKKINEKDTQIELLRKENKELRERIQRLEKKLQIQNS